MSNKHEILPQKSIENRIITIRGVQVMLDSDLAMIYQTETKYINRAVRRNPERFPEAFAFQLSQEEWNSLRFQNGTLEVPLGKGHHRKYLPMVFSDQGIAMLSAALNTQRAVLASIEIMQAFVAMRKFLLNNASVFQRLNQVELRQVKTDEKIEQLFTAMEAGKPDPDKGIFFEGQIFDAWVFASDIIKRAKRDIILIDNYVDDTVLTLLVKRKKQVTSTIYTKAISNVLRLDLEKHNSQYAPIVVKTFTHSHDRFLIIDRKDLYHLGASLKDLGKKWFAFSRMDSLVREVLEKIEL
ncbi:MAG: ORF6N domain-containing protein [Cyclobacteriaceae bacterium]